VIAAAILTLVVRSKGAPKGSSFSPSPRSSWRLAAADDTLQAYLDGMSQLLTDKERPLHRAQQGDNLSTVARARTLTVLTRLDSARKGSVVRFLHESGLIAKDRPILNVRGSDLSEANLSEANLSGADLSYAYLWKAKATKEQLDESEYLEGAIMPDGKRHS
jgi:hypothetical protein